MASIYEGINPNIQAKIRASELKVQETLQAVAENYKRELRTNMDYHRHLAKSASEAGDPNIAVRHNLLADIYQSLLDRA